VSLRLILHPRMEGRLDMAVDEALADAVGRGDSPPVARLYGFAPATLSLGRFQKVRGLLAEGRQRADGITLVRRPTGGHAVLHDSELTYSVALPKGEGGSLPWGGGKREVYMFIARILMQGLAHLGITGTVNAAQRGDIHNPDCFGSAGEFEIAGRGGRKLIGSAQMTTRTAILQHGSIPMENPGLRVFRYLKVDQPADSHPATCLNEETGRIITFEEAREAFARAFRETAGAEDSALLPAEGAAAERILSEKYSRDEWNLSR
jgi:lipoyl(octanoyl) transferase